MNSSPAVERELEGARFVGCQAVVAAGISGGGGDGYLLLAHSLAIRGGDADLERQCA